MNNGIDYNPTPPRAWSRVQNIYSYDIVPNDQYLVYIPLTKQYVAPGIANYQNKQIYKGNILQYKKNSSQLTSKQRYSQIAKGMWTNRTKNYATQSQTYTNPNTNSLLRVNYLDITTSGVPNPFDCSSNIIQDGGSLICNTTVNPCSNKIIQVKRQPKCYPTSCSDVPGKVIDLCWDPRLNTWYPRQRYVMNNSTNKWPENYKAFTSAVNPTPPILTLVKNQINSVKLSWTFINNSCLPISSFNVYQNGKLINSVSYNISTITINGLLPNTPYSFFITSLSTKIESLASNVVYYKYAS